MREQRISIFDRLCRATVNLERNEPRAFALRIPDRNTTCAVDCGPNPIANRENFVTIPLARLHRFGGMVVPIQFPAAVFVIELAPDTSADIRLVTVSLPVFVRLFRAELNARVAVVGR